MNREKYIQDKLLEHYDEAKTLGKEILAVVLQGSQNYKLDIYSDEYKSDVSLMRFPLLTKRENISLIFLRKRKFLIPRKLHILC